MNIKPHLSQNPRVLAAILIASVLFASPTSAQQPGTSPVKVYLMLGQSNMEGQGEVAVGYNGAVNPDYTSSTPGTLEFITDDANDPAGNYDFLTDGSGDWVVRDDVWVHFDNTRRTLNDPTFPINGELQPGFGPVSPDTIGPELGFGHKMGDLHGEQVLLIKIARGGRSIFGDFRPPSAGPYPVPQVLGDDGYLYYKTLSTVEEVTENFTTYFPSYNGQGYEIAGICWHQGWNDKDRTSLDYRTNLAHLIRDLRRDLKVPGCPFVIATSGMAEYKGIELGQLSVEDPAFYPEFDGNVSVIDTRNETYFGYPYEQDVADSPKAEGFHWNRNARTYVHMGLAMGDAMAALTPPRCPSRLGASSGSGSADVTLAWQNGSETPTSVRILRDGVEIAAAATVSPASYADTALTPGTYDYELQFTMPGAPCDPLTLTVNTGITDITATGGAPTVTLEWENNLTYSGIEISRNGAVIEPSLAGTATTYTDTSAPTDIVLTYTVRPTNGTSQPAEVSIGSNLDTSGDSTPPSPGTMTWATPPTAASSTEITMTATTASDENGVEYYFTCTSGGGNDSGWQSSPTYTDVGLDPATQYGYTVRASDLSVNSNANTPSTPEATATTLVAGAVTIADQFVFTNDYTPGDNQSDTGGAATPITILTTGFTSVGADKLVGVISLHNSAATPSRLTALTYGGVNLFPSIFAGNPDGDGFTRNFMFYVDSPVADGDLVLDFEDGGNIDEVGVFLLALDGTAPGFLEATSGDGNLDPVYASAGDFIVGVSQRNNQSMDVSNAPPYTEVQLSNGNLKSAVAHLVATTSGTTAPTFTNTTGSSSLVVFAAATSPSDTTPPTLTPEDIVDDRAGAALDDGFVTYTVSFSEDMNATTVDAADFSNAGTSSILIGEVSETLPGVFSIGVTPTSVGTLQLQVSAGAELTDAAGNLLDTNSAITDDTTITVNSVNSPPVFSSDPISGSDATEDSAYGSTLSGSATDGDDDPLTYAKVSGPAWLSVAANGTLAGTPGNDDVGANSFTISVTDGNIASPITAALNITVINTNDAPVFSVDPIPGGSVTAGEPYSGTLAGSATDHDGNPLTYAKVDGPGWLSVAGNGTLSGTPGGVDVGANSFTVSVTDGIVASPVEATLQIRVDAVVSGIVTVEDIFVFSGDLAQDGAYSSNPGADGGGGDLYGVDKPLTIPVTGFAAAGTDKLVGILTLHNSSARVSPVTSLTYAGADVFPNIIAQEGTGSGSLFSTQIVFYFDSPTTDGNLVIGLDAQYNVDEAGLALFALEGTVEGFLGADAVHSASSPQLAVGTGDFVVAGFTRNNNGNVNASAPYTDLDVNAGNMGAGTAYLIATSDGLTSPTWSSTSSGAVTTIASFAAAEATTPSAYEAWATTNAPTTGGDLAADEDGDGVANWIEFVVGGSISTNDLAKLPSVATDGTNMIISFDRAQQSIDSSTTVSIEVGTDLVTWPDVYAVPGVATAGPPLTVEKNSSPGFDTVTLSAPMAPEASKFARLKVTVANGT